MASQQEVAKIDPASQSEKLPPVSSALQTSYWCQMKGELKEVDFKWTIERFAFFGGGQIYEDVTSIEFDNKFSLNLSVEKEYARLKLISSTGIGYPIRVEIAVIKEKCEKVYQQTIFIPANSLFPLWLFYVAKTNLKLENFVNGEMTISCKIKSLTRKQLMGKATKGTEKCLDETVLSDKNQDRILNQLEEMFEKMPLSDVTFNVRGSKFAAHKNILAMRSPVFAAMFDHPTKELLSSQVEVEDIDPDVFQEILRFIYTGKTQPTAINKMAPGLLAAADKYLLEDLKSQCETHLIRQMSAENCLELLSLTTHHPAEHLKKYAIEYFRRCPGDVMITDNWKKMKEDNPAALCDLQQMVLTAPTI